MTTFPITPPSLGDIRDRVIRLKDLLRAADQIGDAFPSDEVAPLIAVLQVSLSEAREIDRLVDDLFEAEAKECRA